MGLYFCLKYRRPLATTARPDDARTGRRRNVTALLAMLLMLHDGGGEGDSDMALRCLDEDKRKSAGVQNLSLTGFWLAIQRNKETNQATSEMPDISGDSRLTIERCALSNAGVTAHRPSWTR